MALIQLSRAIAYARLKFRGRATRDHDRMVTRHRFVSLGFLPPKAEKFLSGIPAPGDGQTTLAHSSPLMQTESEEDEVVVDVPAEFEDPPPKPLSGFHAAVRQLQWQVARPATRAALLIAVLTAGITAALLWRGRPHELAVAGFAAAATTPSAVAGYSSAPAAVPESSASSPPLVVAVAGKVKHPGLVNLQAGARVADAIAAAGGVQPGADSGLLNLARRLTDGEQVVVGIPGVDTNGPAGPAPSTGGSADAGVAQQQINLNIATVDQLDQLPGVGPVTAQRIIDWRTEHGRFESVDQLQDVSGIGEAKLSQLRSHVTVG